ncbi:hypothetical protein CDD80_2655 [Ophiocordyceps camponoti-rufipedis]|uniref:Uncharacterized protein n=1 Tax=Ophiocordyceps camponoti-rufipedis TaxID=2004952 RepID=A0A2C5YAE2_9HYPO|nr:hypothetical protein CDD80_2655 [Ophiocordyceps camponoti-rufipedis]
MKLLLSYGADVDAADDGGTALAIAAWNGDDEVAELLINHGASLKDVRGADVNIAAVREIGVFSDIRGEKTALQRAVLCIFEGDINHDKGLATVTNAEIELEPPLFWAATGGSPEVVSRLLSAGADATARVKNIAGGLVTALERGCLSKNVQVVDLLLKAGADVKAENRFHKTALEQPPLHTAIRFGTVGMIGLLVRGGADVDAQDQEGWTALHKAARRGEEMGPEMTEVLLTEFKANYTLPTVNGGLPVHVAAAVDNVECLALLVRAGSDINAVDLAGKTPLHWAADKGALRAIEWLMRHGADDGVEACETGMTALDYAERRLREAHLRHHVVRRRKVLAALSNKTA